MNEITFKEVRSFSRLNLKKSVLQKLLLIMVLFGTISLNAQTGTVQIGSGSNTTNGSAGIPVTNYDYSYSQQIVTSGEFASGGGGIGPITKIRYKPTSVGTFTNWNTMTVYIANTTKTEFVSNTDFVPYSELTQVYTGLITPEPTNNNWFELTFSTPFNYTGGNILIAVHETSVGWASSPTFSSYTSSPNSGIVWRQDGSNIDPSTATTITANSRTSNLPQIQFEATLSDCPPPSNILITPSVDGGVATWTGAANGVDYSWKVLPNNAPITDTPLASGTVTGLTATITGLNPATDYDLYVKVNCGASIGESFWSARVDFTTGCAPITTPFIQNFDTTPVGSSANPSTPVCWSFLAPPYVDWDSGYGYTYQWTSYSSPHSFYITNNYDTSGDFILVGPETVDLGNGTMQLRFYAQGDWGGGNQLIVGTMSDPTQATTFTPIPNGTITLTGGFAEYEVPIPAGTNDYFAFKLDASSTYSNVYIDNVHYEPLPSCLGVQFGSLTATGVTDVQATLSWVSSSTNFDIEWGPINFTQGTGTLVSNVANNYVLNGLTQSTEYSYYVRSNCGVDGTSAWRGPYSFVTQTVLPSPWFDGFAGSPATGWSNISSSWSFSLSNTLAGLMPYNSYVLYANLYTESGVGAGVSSPNIGPILAGDKLSFDYRMALYGSPYGPVDSSVGDVEIFISTDFGATYTSIGSVPYGEEGWQNFEYPLASYLGQKVKIKLVVNYNYLPWPDNYDHYVGFDNFYIGSCELPAIPEVTNTTVNSASIAWQGLATDTYEIEYGLAGFAQGTGTVQSVTGITATISGLLAATQYDFYIRKVCSATNNSPWLGKYKFTTSCEVFTTGFVENFDTTDTGSSTNQTVPVCWSFIDGGTGYGYVAASNAFSPAKSFYMYDNGDSVNPYILVSPETNDLGSGYYRVTFKARTATTGTQLIFGTMSNKLDASTFTALQTFSLQSNYNADYVMYLPVGTDDYFAFKHGQNGTYVSINIDNVVYEPIPDCPLPINLTASPDFNALTAQLSWSGPSVITNNNFEIEWGLAGFAQGTGTLVNSTTYSTTISGLSMESSYSYYVRRICANETTAWVGPYTFDMDYCDSDFGSFDGDGITEISISGDILDIELAETYQFVDDAVVSLDAEQTENIALTFETGFGTGYSVYIDFNNNGFDANDRIANGFTSTGEETLTSGLAIPNNGEYVSGTYRMRIVTEYANQNPGPCETGSWGQTFDLFVNVTFPCIQPTNVNFVDVGYEYVLLDWEGQGNSGFELEYGITGFTQGSGTMIQNVTKPFMLEGLTPGTTYDFYIRKNCSGVNSDWSAVATTYVFCDTPAPTGDSNQTLVQDELLSDLIIVGQNLKFYADPGLTIELPASTVLQSSGTFFVTQTINCESDSFLIINVNVLPRIAQPIVNPNQNFCNGGEISDIVVSSLPGATVIWYATLTSTTPLPEDTTLVTGSYYVVQTDGITTSHRLLVQVTVNPTPPALVPTPVHLCGTYTFGNLTINNLPGTTVKWYASENATTPILDNAIVASGTYYVTQSNGTCESERVAYQVSQFDTLNKPIADVQNFCGGGTVADLVAQGLQGAQILWYSSLTAINPLSAGTQLATGTYYVAQTMNGCYSERRAVAVRVVSITAPVVTPFTICGAGTIADLYIPSSNGTTYRWFNSPSSTAELVQNTPLANGTYYVERVQYGCVSARTAVQVTIGTVPNAPTGVVVQSFVEGSTIANLAVNQQGVVWYATYNDSQNGVNPLPSNTPLVNGTTYYAVLIGTNGCPSLPLAVTVDVYLSNNEFAKNELKYFPNPVEDILNISYSERIIQVEVFDLLGKRVKSVKTDGINVEVNLSDLASGTYMVHLKTETKQQFIKVIKQ